MVRCRIWYSALCIASSLMEILWVTVTDHSLHKIRERNFVGKIYVEVRKLTVCFYSWILNACPFYAYLLFYVDNPEEEAGLKQALAVLRDLLNGVEQQVLELERTQRLQEIRSRLDPRSQAKMRSDAMFRPAELLRRQLIHEGTLLWKTPSSRLKGINEERNVCATVCGQSSMIWQ